MLVFKWICGLRYDRYSLLCFIFYNIEYWFYLGRYIHLNTNIRDFTLNKKKKNGVVKGYKHDIYIIVPNNYTLVRFL